MAESDNGAWERLTSETLLETPYFNLRSDRLRLPDGSVKDPYYVLERPDAAIIFPVTPEGEVVLVRQYRPGPDRVVLSLPGGLVDEGEDTVLQLARHDGLAVEVGNFFDLEGAWEV